MPAEITPRRPATLAARAGRWSARHRTAAIALWMAFVVASVAAGQLAGLRSANTDQGVGESARAQSTIDRGFPRKAVTETIIVQAPRGGTVADASVRSAVRDVVAGVSAQPRVQRVRSPLAPGNAAQVSGDRRSALVTLQLRGDAEQASAAVPRVLSVVREVAARHPGVFVGEFGNASADRALTAAFSDDFKQAERMSLPITLLILLLAFGSLVAAGIPLLLGITAVLAALGLVGVASHVTPMDDAISSIILLVGLAVGVDYSLFYLRRARDERRAGASTLEAVERTAATSGRAVLISALTVMVAMSGMFLAGDSTFTSLGLGSIIVVAVAALGSLTFVPAVIAALGDRTQRGRIPFLGRRLATREGHGRFWEAIVGASLRRPLVALVAAGGFLCVLAIPAFSMHTAISGVDDLPRSLEVMRVYDRMQAAFPGGQIPAVVAVSASDVRAPAVRSAIARLRRRAVATGMFKQPAELSVSRDGRVAQLSLPMVGDGADAASVRALSELRGSLVPQTIGVVAGARAYVGGMVAGNQDYNDQMRRRAPLVFGFVLSLAFLLLLFTFRSIVVPVKAIALNLLSVGAAYGVLSWIFVQGHLQGVLGFTSTGVVVSWLPMFLFVILFGLSMDYHVFILSRIREAVDRGRSTEDAVREGVLSTASTVTSAALVMVAVFSIFATLGQIDFKQMGVGLAVAILLDATIVRAILLPAAMQLLGERNWYLPRRLQWLPQTRWEGPPAAAVAGANAPAMNAPGRRRAAAQPAREVRSAA